MPKNQNLETKDKSRLLRYFCDTSTLAKFYVPEAESYKVMHVLGLCDAVYASEFAKAELMAVFHRRLREGKWTSKQFQVVLKQFQIDNNSNYWNWIALNSEITAKVAETYSTLSDNIFLRTADCYHLVTALHMGFDSILTYDKHQSLAAEEFGLKAIQV
ncbi:MAG: type II toxin-antitoxin system VapC family toxin [Leptospira sp.]|nr:type II toxin-antitoxin system VapC family toxin [Leptospira sp.]